MIEETMIRASKKAGFTKQQLFDVLNKDGLMGIYDLGMKHMYEYLKGDAISRKSWYTYAEKLEGMICIDESDDCVVDYDKERGMYRVSVFENGHFWDEFWFDAYEEKELDDFFPHTIGDITYYSKKELFEWVENQQRMNKQRHIDWENPIGGFHDV